MTIGRTFATYGIPFSRAEHAGVDRFLAYYAGRLAVAASAEPLFQVAVRKAGRSGRLRYDYGAWLLRQNRLEEARKQLGHATRLDPDHFEAWIDRGTVQAKLGRLKPARRSFAQALRVDPRSTSAKEHLRTIEARIDAEGQGPEG
jgi:Tfp pilus assembly protein PilF